MSTPPGLLIGGLGLAWRRWSWLWRVLLIVPFILALYAVVAIRTVLFGTNLTEYDAVVWYIVRIVGAYAVAAVIFALHAIAVRVRRPT